MTLEANRDGKWIPVSNEVSVRLALSPTLTPEPALNSLHPGRWPLVSPTPAAEKPEGANHAAPGAHETSDPQRVGPASPPARPHRQGRRKRQRLPTPTRPAWATVFWADRYTLATGECTNLHWQVENVTAVYFNSLPVTGTDTRQVCPTQTTSYTLRIVSPSGTQEKQVQIMVGTANQPAIEFSADSYEIISGQCTMLRWRATDVQAVYLNNQGVQGESSQTVCPTADTSYELRVDSRRGTSRSSGSRSGSQIPMPRRPLLGRAVHHGGRHLHQPALEVKTCRKSSLMTSGCQATEPSRPVPDNATYYTLRVMDNAGRFGVEGVDAVRC